MHPVVEPQVEQTKLAEIKRDKVRVAFAIRSRGDLETLETGPSASFGMNLTSQELHAGDFAAAGSCSLYLTS